MLKRVGRYELLDVLGQGNMATVYRAHDPNINRTLAIKIMHNERCADAELRSRFLREAKAVGILNHPHIVTIYDVGEDNGIPFIAMELIEGEPIDQLLQNKLSLSMILKIGIQIANALHYAHSRNIIHRDIKPSNIIFSRDHSIAKVTDFGIARIDATDITRHTQIGNILGTPQYMSPEQVLGENVDARTDLFSLGTILYQLVSGERPHQADTLTKLLFQIATETPKPIGSIKPDLPADLKSLIDKLLAKSASDRHQSGAEVSACLKKIYNDINPPTLMLSSELPGLKKEVKGAGLAVALLFGGVTSMLYYHDQETQRIESQYRQQYNSAITAYISDIVAEYLLSRDIHALNVLLADFKSKFQLETTVISDHTGRIIASDTADWISKDIEEVSKDETRLVRHPVSYGEQTIGEVLVKEPIQHRLVSGYSLLVLPSMALFSALFYFLIRMIRRSK